MPPLLGRTAAAHAVEKVVRPGGLCGYDVETVALGIQVVDNFLRYVSLHDVCPEHQADVDRARALCARAEIELPMCLELPRLVPGSFNLACQKLF